MSGSTVDQLLDQSIEAYKKNDKDRAAKLISQAIRLDANSERAWLWLSGIVVTDAERLFCIKRILAINPNNEVAQYGLTLLPSDLQPVQPSLEKLKVGNKEVCTFPGCENTVSQPGFKFCYRHWQAVNAPLQPEATLNATAIGDHFHLTSHRVNQVLAELGWISKDKKGWMLTSQGAALGAVQKEHSQTGVPFVQWPESILTNKALLSTVSSLTGDAELPTGRKVKEETSFREKYATPYRSTDGHWVRSKAEMLIDNWLYMSGVVHAYERQLPIEEDVFCDFYIPDGKVYMEYWGLEKDPKYATHKKEKIEIYRKYGLNLIELTDEQVKNLDDFLPKALLKFNVEVS